jgi:CheY-like chemotaxis protein
MEVDGGQADTAERLAHEYKNILQAVGNYGQAALNRIGSGGSAAQEVKRILTCVDRANSMTRSVLAGSETMSRGVPVQVILDDLQLLARPPYDAEIESRFIGDGRSKLIGDRASIVQALLNLTRNACEAMPGGGSLVVSASAVNIDRESARAIGVVRPGAFGVLRVSDTGPGIAPERQGRIFSEYYSTKQDVGCGLGLSFVSGVAQQHGGAVRLYSRAGIGSTFRLYIPAVRDAKPRSRHHDLEAGVGRVLLVDDDIATRRQSASLLTKAGYCVTTAEDGGEAIEIMRRRSREFDLAILDLAMEQMTGLEACRSVREFRPDLPVAFCTGFDPFGPQAEAVRRAGLPIVEKPVIASMLLQAVRKAVNESPLLSR